MNKKNILNNSKGVSMIELLVTVTIILLILAFASTSTTLLRTQAVKNVVTTLQSDLQRSRLRSMTEGQFFGVRIGSDASYTLFTFNDLNNNLQYDGVGEELNTTQNIITETENTSQIRIAVGVNNPANEVIIYDRLGLPRSSTWGLTARTFVSYNLPDAVGFSPWSSDVDPTGAAPNNYYDDEVLRRCVSVSTTRIRQGVWDGAACQEQ